MMGEFSEFLHASSRKSYVRFFFFFASSAACWAIVAKIRGSFPPYLGRSSMLPEEDEDELVEDSEDEEEGGELMVA